MLKAMKEYPSFFRLSRVFENRMLILFKLRSGYIAYNYFMITIRTPRPKMTFATVIYAVRYQVLREPWGQPKGTEKDDYEPISQHYMAVDNSSRGGSVGVVKWLEKSPGSRLAFTPGGNAKVIKSKASAGSC